MKNRTIHPFIRASLRKLNFMVGCNPHIEKRNDWRHFIPEPYKAVLLISADFEMAWAWRYTKSSTTPLQKALDKAKVERENIPKILELCDRYYIPVTWLIVGHLFLESCTKSDGIAHPGLPRPPMFENEWWHYSGKDWFEYDPCTDYKKDPLWYCPDLIKMIMDAKANHEIGCHTFSHIDCREDICPPNLIRSEIRECKRPAQELGISLKSFVHPGHTIGNLNILAEEGFTNYRTDNRNILGYPKKHENELWEFEQTAEFVYRKEWSVDYHIYRYITIIKRAIKSNTVCVLWFHPSLDPIVVEKIWPPVFKFINENSDKIWITTNSKFINKISYED